MGKENYNKSYLFLASFVFSIILHFSAIVLVKYVTNLSFKKPLVNLDYVTVTTNVKKINEPENLSVETEEEKLEDRPDEPEEVQESELPESSFYINFADENADTTLLEQLFREQTLHLRVIYPAEWKFLDQNNNGMLDGITFWASAGNYNLPPYIHLEVKEKYLFSDNRFKFNRKMNDFTAYYNEPEELSGFRRKFIAEQKVRMILT